MVDFTFVYEMFFYLREIFGERYDFILIQAFAQDGPSESKFRPESRMRFMVSGEQWKDPFIGNIYKIHIYIL